MVRYGWLFGKYCCCVNGDLVGSVCCAFSRLLSEQVHLKIFRIYGQYGMLVIRLAELIMALYSGSRQQALDVYSISS